MKKATYGIDAPRVVLTLFVIGLISIGLLVVSIFTSFPIGYPPGWGIFGTSFIAIAAGFLWGSKVGKLRLRDNILRRINWRGDETVLDIGCGRGLLLVGAAKNLTTGKAVGVDTWNKGDLSGNSPAATLDNARMEGVLDRVEVREGDARNLPFEESTFDIVLSSTAIHNIKERKDREKALSEIKRVLKPGGSLYLSDIFHLGEYVDVLRRLGMSEVRRLAITFLFFQPGVLIYAKKPLTIILANKFSRDTVGAQKNSPSPSPAIDTTFRGRP